MKVGLQLDEVLLVVDVLLLVVGFVVELRAAADEETTMADDVVEVIIVVNVELDKGVEDNCVELEGESDGVEFAGREAGVDEAWEAEGVEATRGVETMGVGATEEFDGVMMLDEMLDEMLNDGVATGAMVLFIGVARGVEKFDAGVEKFAYGVDAGVRTGVDMFKLATYTTGVPTPVLELLRIWLVRVEDEFEAKPGVETGVMTGVPICELGSVKTEELKLGVAKGVLGVDMFAPPLETGVAIGVEMLYMDVKAAGVDTFMLLLNAGVAIGAEVLDTGVYAAGVSIGVLALVLL